MGGVFFLDNWKKDALLLEHHMLELGNASNIQFFESSEALIADFQQGAFDIIFFDVYMGGMTGMEAAKVIREIDSEVRVIFTTTSEDFALESYKVSALHYLIKPVSLEGVAEAMERYKARAKPVANKTELVLKGEATPILLKDILYIEVFGKELHIHTTSKVVVSQQLLGNLQQQLPNPPFLHCHRAYIVNLDFVSDIAADFLMDNGDKVYIRKRDYARIRDAYFSYLLGKV